MESIEKLRRYVTSGAGQGISIICEKNILKDLDAIEREVKANRVDAYTEGYDVGFASADDWAAQHEDAMAESGWMRLPVDADGDVLHIGELVDEKLPFGGYAAPAPIDTMELSLGASGYVWMVKLDAENGALINPKLLRHHRAPTVEDVLREFTRDWCNAACAGDMTNAERDAARDDTIAKYAAKLRLAGDE